MHEYPIEKRVGMRTDRAVTKALAAQVPERRRFRCWKNANYTVRNWDQAEGETSANNVETKRRCQLKLRNSFTQRTSQLRAEIFPCFEFRQELLALRNTFVRLPSHDDGRSANGEAENIHDPVKKTVSSSARGSGGLLFARPDQTAKWQTINAI